ncbi:MAG: hypothetical protein V3V75_04630 [Thermoguttaceae bacterium]
MIGYNLALAELALFSGCGALPAIEKETTEKRTRQTADLWFAPCNYEWRVDDTLCIQIVSTSVDDIKRYRPDFGFISGDLDIVDEDPTLRDHELWDYQVLLTFRVVGSGAGWLSFGPRNRVWPNYRIRTGYDTFVSPTGSTVARIGPEDIFMVANVKEWKCGHLLSP